MRGKSSNHRWKGQNSTTTQAKSKKVHGLSSQLLNCLVDVTAKEVAKAERSGRMGVDDATDRLYRNKIVLAPMVRAVSTLTKHVLHTGVS